MTDTLPVIELFGPTIQGEGALVGQRSHFIRFGGCGYRCTWCDSMHAVDPQRVRDNAKWMSAPEILAEIQKRDPLSALEDGIIDRIYQTPFVTLTGGDPMAWDLSELCESLHGAGYKVAVETQGQLYKPWVGWCDVITVSPKGPSSGMREKYKGEVVKLFLQHEGSVLKVPCFDDQDLDFAEMIAQSFPRTKLYITAGTPQGASSFRSMYAEEIALHLTDEDVAAVDVRYSLRDIATKVLQRPKLSRAIVLPQMHVLIWGRELGR